MLMIEDYQFKAPGTYRAPCAKCNKGQKDTALAITVVSDGSVLWWCHRCNDGGRLPKYQLTPIIQRNFSAKQQDIKVNDEKVEKARKKAKVIWSNAIEPASHSYLDKKHVNAYGIREHKGSLVVPLHDIDNELHSLQFLDSNGKPRLLKDGDVEGCFYLMGNINKKIYVCEGYATAATVHEAIEEAVVVTFGASKLKNVSTSLRTKYPNAEIIICADNDQWTGNNPGKTHAIDAAKASRSMVVMPEFSDVTSSPTDFNDLYQLEGIDVVRKQLEENIIFKKEGPLDWLSYFEISEQEATMIENPTWVIKNLIIQGHVTAIVAAPNAGKTTILFDLSGEMARDGYTVVYVNADVSAGDAKNMIKQAIENNIRLLLPDMKIGKSMEDIVNHLENLNESGTDLAGYVFVFDTLKKMTDVINKSQAKRLYKLLRSLSSKGATIVVLGHTNKYNDSDGNPIYEGTGDLRADVDELIYLIPHHNQDGSITVATKPDKVRGDFEPITFEISSKREVTLLDEFIDVSAELHVAKQREKDELGISAIIAAINAGKIKQADILKFSREEYAVSNRQTASILKRYRGQLWNEKRGNAHNVCHYILIE